MGRECPEGSEQGLQLSLHQLEPKGQRSLEIRSDLSPARIRHTSFIYTSRLSESSLHPSLQECRRTWSAFPPLLNPPPAQELTDAMPPSSRCLDLGDTRTLAQRGPEMWLNPSPRREGRWCSKGQDTCPVTHLSDGTAWIEGSISVDS